MTSFWSQTVPWNEFFSVVGQLVALVAGVYILTVGCIWMYIKLGG